MKIRILLSAILLISIFSSVAGVFWYQESQYLLPTPIPSDYRKIEVGQNLVFSKFETLPLNNKPVVLHFFNPNCPCSRFNMDHFSKLVEKYNEKCTFYAVLQVDDSVNSVSNFKEKYNLHIPVIIDFNKELAKICGVYSTPQAVIINNKKLYYRGNYNKSRYCTSKNSNFAQMALDSLLAGNQPPAFMEAATQAYGCQLPDSNNIQNIFTMFK